MAQRRMFSKEITNSSEFMMMSPSAQNLYFHFGMNADDDGFCEVFTIVRMTESKPDDLRSLHERGFIYIVDNKVCIIKDWHENNKIRQDRYQASKYLDDANYREAYTAIMSEKVKEISMYSGLLANNKSLVANPQPDDNQKTTVGMLRVGEGRVGEERVGKVNKRGPGAPSEETKTSLINAAQWHLLIDGFKPVNPMFVNLYKFKTERTAIENMVKQLGLDTVLKHIASLEAVCSLPFAPKITKPTELEKQLGKLIIFEKQLTGNNNKLANKNPAIENKYSNIKNN